MGSTLRKPAGIAAVLLGALALVAPSMAAADREDDGPDDSRAADQDDVPDSLERPDPGDALERRDAQSEAMPDERPSGKPDKSLEPLGRGERLLDDATTDVWVHNDHAYLGTFNTPCGTGESFEPGVGSVDLVDGVDEPGLPIFDVANKTRPAYVGNLPSVAGSRVNDVKVNTLNSGDVLVHSNEACADGPGGIEVYGVDDPANPVHLSSIRIDERNPIADALFGGLSDVGVHNAWLFTQGERDYVAVVAETVFETFRVYDLTDPTSPELVAAWGAEELFDPGVGEETDDVGRVLAAALDLVGGGFGASPHKFLHDVTVSADGTKAYLSNWDAGLVLLDLADLAGLDEVSLPNERVVSVARNVEEGSLDGEVNSHAAWPSEDGSIVVETEEDFSAWERQSPPSNLTFGEGDPATPLPGVAIATAAGDDFEENPTGNTATVDADAVTVTNGPLAGTTYPAIELDGDQPRLADTGSVPGEAVFIGRACDGDEVLNAEAVDEGGIAVVRRGACTFREKNFNAAGAGADAIVIANNVETSTPWGGVRIWDYSDPAEPQLASTFNTACSAAAEPVEGCDPAGTYSVHNVVVDSRDDKTFAYISWYRDGMLVLDITDPSNPREVARFFDDSEEFREANGGNPHDFWGVHKLADEPWVYGSDRNGGLSVFKLLGSGSEGRPGRGPGPGPG